MFWKENRADESPGREGGRKGGRGPGVESRTIKLYTLYIEKLQSKVVPVWSPVCVLGAPSAAGGPRRCEGDRRLWEWHAEGVCRGHVLYSLFWAEKTQAIEVEVPDQADGK